MNRRSLLFAAGLAAALGLSACATPTPYQPNVPGQPSVGGYSELKLEPDRFRVNFQGNSLTSRETVESYMLFRAAELSLQQGYDWFRVVDRDTDKRTQTYVDPDPFYRPWYGSYGYFRPTWRYRSRGLAWRTWDPFWGDPFWGDRVDVRTVDRFEATAEIVMGKGAKPAADPGAFDAHAVVENLRSRIQLPAPKA